MEVLNKMIEVTIGTNTSRKKVTVDPSKSLKTVLNENAVKYETATMHLDGSTLSAGDLNKSFSDFGIIESCALIAVVKSENNYFVLVRR